MANIIQFDTNSGRVLRYLKSVNTPMFVSRPDCLINPDVSNIDLRYAIVENRTLRNMTQAERDAAIAQYKLDHYAELRAEAYPPIRDQIDIILKQFALLSSSVVLSADMQNLLSSVQAIKDQYPKPVA